MTGQILLLFTNKRSLLNDSLGQVRTYVGSDGKLHFVDASGADSVLPFNKSTGIYIPQMIFTLYGGQTYIKIDDRKTLTIGEISLSTNKASCTVYGIDYTDTVETVLYSTGYSVSNITIDVTNYKTIRFHGGASEVTQLVINNVWIE